MAQILSSELFPPPRLRCTQCAYATNFEAGASAHSVAEGHFVTSE